MDAPDIHPADLPLRELVDPARSALVLVDVTNDFCDHDGHFARTGNDMTLIDALIDPLTRVLEAARSVGVTVVHIQNTVLAGGASDSGAFMRFKGKIPGGTGAYTVKGTWGWEIYGPFAPEPVELIVEKHRPSAFVGTDLDQLLRVARIETVIVGGLATEGCVQSTAVDAMFRDYFTVLLEDCVGTYSQELQAAGLAYLRPRVDIVSSADVLESWGVGVGVGVGRSD